jgi:hypothetical protein
MEIPRYTNLRRRPGRPRPPFLFVRKTDIRISAAVHAPVTVVAGRRPTPPGSVFE